MKANCFVGYESFAEISKFTYFKKYDRVIIDFKYYRYPNALLNFSVVLNCNWIVPCSYGTSLLILNEFIYVYIISEIDSCYRLDREHQ